MKKEKTFFAGQKFGRWTVLDEFITTPKRERKWLCRCDCGIERYVLERSLKHGGSLSCGCLREEQARKAISLELTGKVFGELTVLHKAEHQRKNGGIWWTCRCACGNLYDVPASLLETGRRTHCGDKNHPGNYARADITGQRFHRLVALYATDARDAKGSVVWHCRCDCGNEVDVPYNSLVYCNIKSCGCRKKEHDKKLNSLLTHVDGTSLDMIRSKKVPVNNTTGTRGVYFIRGKYCAKITFQKKTYTLGSFERIEEAIQARREAEENLFDRITHFYARYQTLAEMFSRWAQQNPVQISVEQDETKAFSVQLSPNLNEAERRLFCGEYA